MWHSRDKIEERQSVLSKEHWTHGHRVIDHIQRFSSGVLQLESLRPPVASDHKAVVATIKLRWKCASSSGSTPSKIRIDQVAYDKDARLNLDGIFARRWEQCGHTYDDFCNCASQSATELNLPSVATPEMSSPWDSSMYKRISQTLEGDVSASMSPIALEVAMRNALDSSERACATSLVEAFSASLSVAWWRAWEAWKFVFAVKRSTQHSSASLVDVSDFRRHFQTLLQPPEAPGELILPPQQIRLVFDRGRVSQEEVKEATVGLGFHRASGADAVPNELLTCKSVQTALTEVFNMWLDASRIQSSACKLLLVPLFKNGDKSLPGNYRGISLQSSVVKESYSAQNQLST